MSILLLLIGDQEVQSNMLKIKDNVHQVGHLVQLVFQKDFTKLEMANYQIYQNNNQLIVVTLT
ncbi:unnamed protein product [Paramecium sonneborni]|uniref:Uncharacterized protein n=1 Tax=Paramecium sonneborni TaxID=65129 RepID=A0A8S1JVM0_9CILI|nr:unnamed protein product [Paramecium sonneborni]